MELLSIEVWNEGDATVICPTGALDVSSTVHFQESVASMMLAGGSIVVDLSRLTFIDSAGLSSLARVHRAAELIDSHFEVRGAHGRVADVLEQTGLDTVLLRGDEGEGSGSAQSGRR
jgi:anti-anti-sigma factor